MNFEDMSGMELLRYYKNYVHNFEIDPNAPEDAKKAFAIAKARGQYKKELWEKKRILLG